MQSGLSSAKSYVAVIALLPLALAIGWGQGPDPIDPYWYGHPRSKVCEIVDESLPRTIHFHAKNVRYPAGMIDIRRTPGWQYAEQAVPVADGDLDFERFIRLLLDSDYEGYISVEDDSLGRVPVEQRLGALQGDVAFLRGVIGGFLGRRGL